MLGIFEISAIAVLVWVAATQVLLPFAKGTRLFPLFSREAKLRRELEALEEKMKEQQIERKIEEKLNEQFNDINRRIDQNDVQ